MFSLIRRVGTAVGIAGLLAVVFRLRGEGGTPPSTGGWKEVSESDLG